MYMQWLLFLILSMQPVIDENINKVLKIACETFNKYVYLS